MKSVLRPKARPIAVAVALLGTAPAAAFQLEFDNGIRTSIDTTVSYGISVRTSDRDPQLIGIANGGTSRSVNEDNGDLNFDKNRPFANVIKATTDVEVKWKNFGFFGRGTAFYDFDLHDSDKLGPTGKDRLGQDVVGLDGYLFASFEPMSRSALTSEAYQESRASRLWRAVSAGVEPRRAGITIAVALVVLGLGLFQARGLKVGDYGIGVPELRPDSRYNQDNATIVRKFAIGVNTLGVVAQTQGVQGACTNYEVMSLIDAFDWHMDFRRSGPRSRTIHLRRTAQATRWSRAPVAGG